MMDDIDITDARVEKEYAEFFKKRQHTSFTIDGTGLCTVCGNIVQPVVIGNKSIIGRWCSKECRDEWSENNE